MLTQSFPKLRVLGFLRDLGIILHSLTCQSFLNLDTVLCQSVLQGREIREQHSEEGGVAVQKEEELFNVIGVQRDELWTPS